MQKKISKLKAYRFRILSGVLFLFFLTSTWLMFYQKPEYPEELHISLQEQLKAIIQEKLLEQKPLVRNFRFKTIWTQSTYKRGQISAHFKYSFDDNDQLNLSVEGKALMNRKEVGADDKYDLWSVDNIEINNTKLKFQEPVTLFSVSEKFEEDTEESTEDSMKLEEGNQNEDTSTQETLGEDLNEKELEKKEQDIQEEKIFNDSSAQDKLKLEKTKEHPAQGEPEKDEIRLQEKINQLKDKEQSELEQSDEKKKNKEIKTDQHSGKSDETEKSGKIDKSSETEKPEKTDDSPSGLKSE